MKVLRINTSASRGGAALSALNIQKAILDLGVDTWMLTARDQQSCGNKLLSLGESGSRLQLNILLYRLLGIEGYFNKDMWKRYLSVLMDYDLIHLHNVHGYYMPLDVLEVLLSKPCVWTLHDFWLTTGGPGFPPPSLKNKKRAERFFPFANLRYPAEWIDRSIKRRQRLFSLIRKYQPALVAVSNTMSDRLSLMGLDKKNLTVIPHGFYNSDLAPHAAVRKNARENKCWPFDKHIFFFASAQVNNPVKGFDVFMDALRYLPNDHSWVAFIAGDKFVSVSEKNKELCSNIQFLGRLKDSEMTECFRACDTYVTSTFDETFGRTVVEALAEGAEVVCSDLPVLHEVAGNYAIFFATGDAVALSKQLLKVLRSPVVEKRYVVANEVRTKFSQKKMARKYLNLYESVSNKKALPPQR